MSELEERLRRGEAREAVEAARRHGDAAVEKLRADFLALLRARGYFVKTPEDVAASLREIEKVGPGFDLFDLSDALRPKERSHGA